MAQIITYPKLSTLANNDLLLVSDVSSKNKNTNSLEVDTLAQYIITTNNVIKGGGTLNYVPIFTPTGTEIGDSQLQQSPPNTFGMYQMRFNNADRFIINKPSSVTAGDPEYLIQQDGNYKVSFGWDDDGGGFGFIYNWAGNGLKLGAQGQNPQFELNTVIPKIISHTAHEFEGQILDINAASGAPGQVLSSTGAGVEWITSSSSGVTGTGTTNTIPLWTDGPAGVIGDSVLVQDAAATQVEIVGANLNMGANDILNLENLTIGPNPSNPVLEVLSEEVVGGNFQAAILSLRANETSTGAPQPRGSVTIHGKNSLNAAGANSLAIQNFKEGADVVILTKDTFSVTQITAKFKDKGDVQLPQYGSGSFTAPATFYLAVDTNGFIIEEPVPSNTSTILINGLVNNLASAGTGGYDFMEWVSNVTSATQIPVMKTPRDIVLKSVSYSWMGDTALSIGVGEQVAFTIGTIPSGVNPVIANYTSALSLFDLTNADDGTYANDVVTGLNQAFGAGDVIAVVGQETGTVTPNSGELSLTFEFEVN